MATATNVQIIQDPNTDRDVVATWDWDKNYTASYTVRWWYITSLEIPFLGSESTIGNEPNNSRFTVPDDAYKVWFHVKPISETYTSNGNEVSHWTADWSTQVDYWVKDLPPLKPDVPDVEIENYTLTATLDNLNVNATYIEFQIVSNNSKVFNTGTAMIEMSHVSYSCPIDSGSEYKVRCRSVRAGSYSEWSDYSANETTKPASSLGITTCKATSETSVFVAWEEVPNATSYELEYASKEEYFDRTDQTMPVSDIKFAYFEVVGLESGSEYFFRVRAANDKGESAWSSIVSVVIGSVPAAPTTWSSTTTAITGEPLTLYWIHNSEDNSSQMYADVELYFNGRKETYTIRTDEEEDDEKTMYFDIDTSEYPEGTKIEWRVRTAGVTKEYGDWSIQRTVDIYTPPTLALSVTDVDGEPLDILRSFPFYISGIAGPNTQTPIGYHLVITANDSYETVDNVGNTKMISVGESVYSKHFNTSEDLVLIISAANVDLNNNISYTLTCTVSMDSGLTAESSIKFTVRWSDDIYEPNAEIGINRDTLTAYIRPYCENSDGTRVEGISLSVYRREFDGTFTELATGIRNNSNTFVSDPHPALDYARYRVVAITDSTGAVSYYDLPGYPVGEKAVIIQWNETWSTFDVSSSDILATPPWSGSLLKLPYNINVSEDVSIDVSLIEYIGRRHPVTYYGTQVGETATWNVEIPKHDVDTIYALRRLRIWMGDVYVREPSGTGYWANISVSFSQNHREKTIPVTLNIKRVSGGA